MKLNQQMLNHKMKTIGSIFGLVYKWLLDFINIPGFNQGRKVEIISLKKLESGTWRKSSSPTSDILIFFW